MCLVRCAPLRNNNFFCLKKSSCCNSSSFVCWRDIIIYSALQYGFVLALISYMTGLDRFHGLCMLDCVLFETEEWFLLFFSARRLLVLCQNLFFCFFFLLASFMKMPLQRNTQVTWPFCCHNTLTCNSLSANQYNIIFISLHSYIYQLG